MRRALGNFIVWIICAGICFVAAAADKIDVSTIITKSEAEALLGEPVKDPQHSNKEGNKGLYDSECSYYAQKGDKALVVDLLVAAPGIAEKIFSTASSGETNPTNVDGLGDRAVFYEHAGTLYILNVVKGDTMVTVGMHGVSAATALEQEKSTAKKILALL
jgi:hypothetical protein